MKIPCAVSAVWSCGEYLPAFCIITFGDVLEKVYHAPLEKYKTYVLTDQWVNSALSVEPCTTENELLCRVTETVSEKAGILPKHHLDGGLRLPKGFLLISDRLFYRCFPMQISETERNILLFLLLTGTAHSARQITAYCYPDTYKGDSRSSVSAAVSRINRGIEALSGMRVISYSRKQGGYVLETRVTKEI